METFGIPGEKEPSRWGNHPGISPGMGQVLFPHGWGSGGAEPRLYRSQMSWSQTRLLLQSSFLGRLGFILNPPSNTGLFSVLSSQELNFPQPSQIIHFRFFFPPISTIFQINSAQGNRMEMRNNGAQSSAQPHANDGNKSIY